MRTLTIAKCLPYISGPSVMAFEEARILAEMGHGVDFLTYQDYPSGTLPNFDRNLLRASGVNFHYVAAVQDAKLVAPMLEVAFLSKTIEIVRLKGIEVIHAQYALPHGLTAIAASKFLGVPSVVTVCGSDIRSLSYLESFSNVAKFIFDEVDLLIAVSQNLAQEIFRFMGPNFGKKIYVLETAVDVDKFTKAQPSTEIMKLEGPKFLYAGRLANYEKRLDVLLLAFGKVLQFFPKAKFILVGINSGNYQIECEVGRLGLEESVILLGGVFESLPSIYKSVDLFVLSSDQEGLPASVIEAAASGLPIVTTPVGSIPDHFVEGRNCLFAQIGDPESLALKIMELLNDRMKMNQMGLANMDLARTKFNLRVRCQHLIELMRVFS